MRKSFFSFLKKAFTCSFLFVTCYDLLGGISNIGIPLVRYYTREQYRAGMQNWSILQGNDGIMYFGNNYGLLEFTGREWRLDVQPANKTIVRSLAIDEKGTMYIGAQNEFGYVKTNVYGRKQYISISALLDPAERNFSDIWNISIISEGICFYSSEGIFLYNGTTIKSFRPKTSFIGAYKVSDSLYVQSAEKDIYVFEGTCLRKIIRSADIQGYYVRNIFPYKDGNVVIVSDQDILVGKGKNFKNALPPYLREYFKKQKIFCSLMLRNGYFVFGTVRNGILVLDNNFAPVQVINTSNGLKNNTILALGSDDLGNVWVATDNGIGYIELATPLYKIENYYNLEGSVYSMLETGNKLYVGTNSGLYSSIWNEYENPLFPTLDFRLTADLSGQVWNIYNVSNKIYVCHNDGMYKIEGDKKTKVSEVSGTWNLLNMKDTKFYIQGTYYGFVVYELINNELKFRNKVKGFSESSRIIEFDHEGNLWMAHGYKGIYKLRLNKNLDSITEIHFYNRDKGFPTSNFINMFKVKNELLFGTELGVFQYDYKLDTMIESSLYNKIIGNTTHIRLLKDNGNKDVWYIKGIDMSESTGIIHFYDDGKWETVENPFQRLRGRFVPGFESLVLSKSGNALFGTENGIVIYNNDINRNYQKPFHAIVTKVKGVIYDTIVYGFENPVFNQQICNDIFPKKLQHKFNSLSISYSATFFEGLENIVFSSFLEGFDKTWSDWDMRSERQYTNLSAGKYKFHVKAKNVYGFESSEGIYEFEINPPWYASIWAFILYVILGAGIVYLIFRYTLWYVENEKKKLRLNHINELRKKHAQSLYEKVIAENKIKSLSEEKLLNDLSYKNSQLTSTNINVMQMNEVFLWVKEKLMTAMGDLESEHKKPFRQIIVEVDNKLKQKDNWENFELHFNAVHNDFLRRLKNEFPDLNYRDIRLCAYLRLNLSSKEISNLMGISVRGIESIRYRVRRKIKLKTTDSLTDFLLHY